MLAAYKESALNILEKYYSSLNTYRTSKVIPLTDPLWQLRLLQLEEDGIFDALKEIDHTYVQNDDALFLLDLTLSCNESLSHKVICFNSLLVEAQKKLIIIADVKNKHVLAPYATSLLITLFLRDTVQDFREAAIKLLSTKEYSGELTIFDKIDLKLMFLDLLEVPYVDFSFCQFFGLIKLNLAGQFLKNINANSVRFDFEDGKNSLRYACLQEANLHNTKFSEEYDFTGASACGAVLTNITATKVIFNEVNFYDANLQNSNVASSFLKNTNVKLTNFTRTTLTGAEFFGSVGLSSENLKNAENIQGLLIYPNDLRSNEIKALNELPKEKGRIKIDSPDISHKTVNCRIEELVELIDREQIQDTDSIVFPLWPKEMDRWENNSESNSTFCNLKKEDSLYQLIEEYVYLTSDSVTYESQPWEASRFKKVIDTYNPIAIIHHAVKDLIYPPIHKGQIGSITIHSIKVNNNSKLLQRYNKRKDQITKELKAAKIKNPLSDVTWEQESVTGLPIINSEIGECLLFHGTPHIASIQEKGFDTSYSVDKLIGGYGPLGKAIYCSDSFAKADGYASCKDCKLDICKCPGGTATKVIFVTRALLGNVLVDKHKGRIHETTLSENYHSVWGPCKGKNPDSELRQNEFAISNEDQVYPEYCIYYTVNNPELKESPVNDNDVPLSEKDFKLFEKVVYWPHRPAFNRLKKQIEKVLNEQNHLLNDQTAILKKLLKFILQKEQDECISEKKYSSLKIYWAFDYFQCRQYPKALNILNSFNIQFMPKTDLLRMSLLEVSVAFHCKKFTIMVRAFNRAWLVNPELAEKYLIKKTYTEICTSYYQHGLKSLQKDNALENDRFNQEIFIKRIANWTVAQLINCQWDFDTWEKNYWELSCSEQRKIFRKSLYRVTDTSKDLPIGFKEFADHIADEHGHSRKLKESRNSFHQNISDIIQKEENDVEIRWLDYSKGKYKIKEGYLKGKFISTIFDDNNKLHPRDREEEGRSLVICLKNEEGKSIVYLKFYPHYPLRQFAVDSFCARLSGYHAETTLSWIKHKKCKFGYPVLLSKPLGQTLLQYEKMQNSKEFVSYTNPYAFTWKFFETLLIRPGDNKSDNLIPIKVPYDVRNIFKNKEDKEVIECNYAWISLDTDVCFEDAAVEKKNVHIFAIEFLLEQMDEQPSYTAMLSYLRRDWPGLFTSWLNDIKAYTEALNGDEINPPLFSNDEIDYYKALKNRVSITSGLFNKRGFSVDCNVTSLFRDNDISRLNERVYEIKIVLQKYILRNQHLSTEKVSHWPLMQEINYPLSQAYKQVYKKGVPLSLSFQMLPGIDENFQRKTISLKYCSLVLMFNNEVPHEMNSLAIPTSTAYIRINKQLYYVDILKNIREEIEINETDLALFDKRLEIKTLSKEIYSRILKEEELEFIAKFKGCAHITHRLTEESLITSQSKHLAEERFIEDYSVLPNQITKLKKMKFEKYYNKFMALLEGVSNNKELEIIRQPCYVVIEAPFAEKKIKALKVPSNTVFIRVKKATQVYYFDKNTNECIELSKDKEVIDIFDKKLGIGWFSAYDEPKILTCAKLDEIMQIPGFKHLISRQFTDLMRGKVINQIHWDKFTSQISEQLLEVCHRISFQELKFSGCKKLNDDHFQKIISNSPSLKTLNLTKCDTITSNVILNLKHHEFLRKFYIENMSWQQLEIPSQTNTFLQLQILKITQCQYLKTCDLFFPNLVQLIIRDCEKLISIKILAPYLRKLVIDNKGSNDLKVIVNKQKIDLRFLIHFNKLRDENEDGLLQKISSSIKNGDLHPFVALIDIKLKEKAIAKFSESVLTDSSSNFDRIWADILILLQMETRLTKLVLANYKSLNNKILQTLLTNNPLLQELDVTYCEKLTGNLGSVIALCPKLEVLKLNNTNIERLEISAFVEVGSVRIGNMLELLYLKELYLNNCIELKSVEINTNSLTILEMKNASPKLILKGTFLSSPRLANVSMSFADKSNIPQAKLINYCPFLLREKAYIFQQDNDISSKIIGEFTNVNFKATYLSVNEKNEISLAIQEIFLFNENLRIVQDSIKGKTMKNPGETILKKIPPCNYDAKTEDELFLILVDPNGGTDDKESALVSIEKKLEKISAEKIAELNNLLFTEQLRSIRVLIALLLLKLQGQTDKIIEILTTVATKDMDNQVRRQAVEAMRLLPYPNRQVIDALIEELNITTQDTSALRSAAATSLFGIAKIIDGLITSSLKKLSEKLNFLNKIPIKHSRHMQDAHLKITLDSEVLQKIKNDSSANPGVEVQKKPIKLIPPQTQSILNPTQGKKSDFYLALIKEAMLYGKELEGNNVSHLIQEKDSYFKKSEKFLKDNADFFGFECYDVPGDGNCFYVAVADQLNLFLKTDFDKKQLGNCLRKLACEHIEKHKNIYQGFIEAKELKIQSKNKSWVEESVITALCYALNVNLILVRSDGAKPTINKLTHGICTLTLGYQLELHYQSLHPANGKLNEEKQFLLSQQFENNPFHELQVPVTISTSVELKITLQNLLLAGQIKVQVSQQLYDELMQNLVVLGEENAIQVAINESLEIIATTKKSIENSSTIDCNQSICELNGPSAPPDSFSALTVFSTIPSGDAEQIQEIHIEEAHQTLQAIKQSIVENEHTSLIGNNDIRNAQQDNPKEIASNVLKKAVSDLVGHKLQTKQFTFKITYSQPLELCIHFVKAKLIMKAAEIEDYLIDLCDALEKDLIDMGLANTHYGFEINDNERKLTIKTHDIMTMNRIGLLLQDAGQDYWNPVQLVKSNLCFFKPQMQTIQTPGSQVAEQHSMNEITCTMQ